MDGALPYHSLTGDSIDQQRKLLLESLLQEEEPLNNAKANDYVHRVQELWVYKDQVASKWENESFHFLMHYLSDADIMQLNPEYRDRMRSLLKKYASQCK